MVGQSAQHSELTQLMGMHSSGPGDCRLHLGTACKTPLGPALGSSQHVSIISKADGCVPLPEGLQGQAGPPRNLLLQLRRAMHVQKPLQPPVALCQGYPAHVAW